MNTTSSCWLLVLVGLAAVQAVPAQTSSAPADTPVSQSSAPAASSAAPSSAVPSPSAQSEAGEPRAMTSPDAAARGADPQRPSEKPEEASGAGHAARPARTRHEEAAANGRAKEGSAEGKTASADHLELGTATVTGDREQPKVMYIVPWKRSDIGDLSGKPMNSLLDEALAPVDRDEFKREVMYYQAVRSDASQNGASKAQPQGEK